MEKNLRNFGFSEIKWKIKNFLAATCKEKWVVWSPTFTINGKISTQWRFCLKDNYIDEKHTVSMYLESMNRSINEPMWVTWKLFIPKDIDEDRIQVAESDFQTNNSIAIELTDADELQSIMEFKDVDELKFRNMIFVSIKDSQVHKRSEMPGLKALSQDLTTLYRVDDNYDVKFLIGGIPGKAHKFILSSRSTVLKSKIARAEEVIKIPELDAVAARQIFGYLYTGNLDHVLRKPTFEILEWIKYLDLTQLQKYYEPDFVEILSEFKREKSSLEFDIPLEKIANSNEVISFPSSESGSNLLERIFTLSLFPNRGTGEDGYMSICINNMEENYSDIYQAEVAVIDSEGKSRYLQRKQHCDFNQEIAFEVFLPADSLEDSTLTWGGSLHILCYLYTSDTAKGILSTIKNDVVYYNIHVDPEEHYKMLTYHMALLYETGTHSDFTLECDGQEFPVHSSILSARSHVFRDLFKYNHAKNAKSLHIPNMKSRILKCVLYYIYCGKLLYYEIDDLIDIYVVAVDKFCVLPLKYECCRLFEENLESLDVKSVLHLALEYNEYKLIATIRKFISCKKSDNEDNDD